jgi:hypothetical protein
MVKIARTSNSLVAGPLAAQSPSESKKFVPSIAYSFVICERVARAPDGPWAKHLDVHRPNGMDPGIPDKLLRELEAIRVLLRLKQRWQAHKQGRRHCGISHRHS